MEAPQTQDFRGVWSGQDVESVFLEGGSGKEAYGFLVLGNEYLCRCRVRVLSACPMIGSLP